MLDKHLFNLIRYENNQLSYAALFDPSNIFTILRSSQILIPAIDYKAYG